MLQYSIFTPFAAGVALALACNSGATEVQQETQDLREAQTHVPKVTKELEADLEKAKAEVVRLEQKLALARQGVTDEVLAERKELQDSIQAQERKVQSEIDEARKQAAVHSQDTAKAAQQLEQTTPPARVEAEVQTTTTVVPSTTVTETTQREERIPVAGREVIDTGEPTPTVSGPATTTRGVPQPDVPPHDVPPHDVPTPVVPEPAPPAPAAP